MTDLEITKACAEAMGYVVLDADKPDVIERMGIWCSDIANGRTAFVYDPMGIRGGQPFDAQAMALVKKFRISINAYNPDYQAWPCVADPEISGLACTFNADLNRAICECVYKLHTAKRVA